MFILYFLFLKCSCFQAGSTTNTKGLTPKVYISFLLLTHIIILCLRPVMDSEKIKIHLGLDMKVPREKIYNSDPNRIRANPNLLHFKQGKLVNRRGLMMSEKALLEGRDKIIKLSKQLFGCGSFIITLNSGPIF